MNFRRTTLLFFLILLSFNLIYFFISPDSGWVFNTLYQHPWFFYLPLILLYLSISIILAFFPCSQFHFKPVLCQGKQGEKNVSITFDDGPDPKTTPLIIDILRKKNIKATFFLIGKNIIGNETIVKTLQEEGHLIGNHSFSHSGFWDFLTSGKMYQDLMKTDLLIQQITGMPTTYFRPPYGVINPMVSKAAAMTSYKIIAWSIRSFDTIIRNPVKLLKRITGNLTSGDIILLHDNQSVTVNILAELIDVITAQGFRIVPLDQLINQVNYE